MLDDDFHRLAFGDDSEFPRSPVIPPRPGYGETVADCRVDWRLNGREPGDGLWSYPQRLRRVAVQHIGKNRAQFVRRNGEVVRVRLIGKHIKIVAPDGRDLVSEWRE